MENVVSQRYAVSIYELAQESGALDTMFSQLMELQAILKQNPDYLKLLSTPMIPKEKRASLAREALGSGSQEYIQNFISLLIDKNRIILYPQIAEDFKKMYYEAKGICEAWVTTAVQLSEPLAAKLTAKLEAITRKKILLIQSVDSELLGGIVIQISGKQIDASVKNQLDGLRRQFSAFS